jgi:hypothetical protein
VLVSFRFLIWMCECEDFALVLFSALLRFAVKGGLVGYGCLEGWHTGW